MPPEESSVSAYEEALDALSSLITRRTRADGTSRGDRFDLMFDYLKILELEGPISEMKVIHVAGTKGKGSTCTFTESILRNCGFCTGLFTSPHLIDVRERFRLDGVEISEEKFLAYFWWCWSKLKEKTSEDVPMPTYFCFLALLAFKIFSAEQVDVAILEVGLGGKFDATNVVQRPIVCGISSLGYDHMEIFGNTLGEIAGEKAGIFKPEVPAFTVPQPEEAISVLENKASQLGIPLQVVPPLDIGLLNCSELGLTGEHQYLNAGLAVALSYTWLQKTGHSEGMCLNQTALPEEFVQGLATANFQGRAQIVPDPHFYMENECSSNLGGLIFFLDGAHSPESLDMCAKWYSHAIKQDIQQQSSLEGQLHEDPSSKHGMTRNYLNGGIKLEFSGEKSKQILLFNCMSVRDPWLLFPRMVNACAAHGVHFHKALFVPNQSVFNKVGSHALQSTDPPQVDLSWQLTLQRVWEGLVHVDKGSRDSNTIVSIRKGEKSSEPFSITGYDNSSVFPSLPLAITWLRDSVRQNRLVRFQVLVTGSLHLVGDVLRLIKK